MNQPAPRSITSQDFTIERLFSDFYVVPNFQREYVWTETQVDQLLDDVFAEFPKPTTSSDADEYFIGSIVVSYGEKGEDEPFEVIDGQQRVTTAYIFLCAVKNYILKLENHRSVGGMQTTISTIYTNSKGIDVPRYRVSLQYEDSQTILEKIAQDEVDLDIKETSKSVDNVINAYRNIQSFLKLQFDKDELEIRRFYGHFTKKVKLVRVLAMSVTRALRLFETINNRGVGLDPMDLLKNLMFRETEKEEFEKLKIKWKELTDAIEHAKEKPTTFLRYFIYSQYEGVEREEVQSKVYEWFLDKENKVKCGYSNDPIKFVETLVESANSYFNFSQGKNKDGSDNRHLKNIKYLTPTTKQHMSLLLASQHLSTEVFQKLCHEIENLLFVFIITSQKTNEFERPFIQWASELRKVNDEAELSTFIAKYIQPEKQKLFKRFESTLLELKEKDFQGPKIKYILAKLTQYINELALGSDLWGNLEAYTTSRQVEIEHILSQSLTNDEVKTFDKPMEIKTYISYLGNLTLLEKPINASISNSAFNVKKDGYKNSSFILTRSIAAEIVVGKNTAIDRAVRDLKSFENWCSDSIVERQRILTELAKKVWNVTEATYSDQALEEKASSKKRKQAHK